MTHLRIESGSTIHPARLRSRDLRLRFDANQVYASIPTVYADGFSMLKESAPPTVFVWLFPLLPDETAFVQQSGWSEFENRLELINPDLFDVCRTTVF